VGAEIAAFSGGARRVLHLANALVGTWQQGAVVSRSKVQELRIESERMIYEARARATGDLIRLNIIEIVETARLIESANLTGIALVSAMGQLQLLSDKLAENLRLFLRNTQ
jgi:hypothetical protein